MNSEQSDVDYRFTLIINRTSERRKNLASDSECESLNYAQQKVVVWQVSSGCNLQDATKFSKKVSKCQKTTTSKSFLRCDDVGDYFFKMIAYYILSTLKSYQSRISHLSKFPANFNKFQSHKIAKTVAICCVSSDGFDFAHNAIKQMSLQIWLS